MSLKYEICNTVEPKYILQIIAKLLFKDITFAFMPIPSY